ncbi:MAG: hypothetical protein KF734_00195 [Saprospiraceae bacterium]|nr:hypothetical protein [Saprospiraceae bacterium]
MKLQQSILFIFIVLLGLVAVSNLHAVAAALAMMAVPPLIIWQVIIALRHKEPVAEHPAEFDDQWYENP